MTSNVQFLTPQTTYEELQKILIKDAHLKALPVVETLSSMILLGSSSRKRLIEMLDRKVGVKARQAEAYARLNESFDELERRFKPTEIMSVDSLQPLETNKKANLPNKMKFYYNDLPEDYQKSVDDENEQLRKMSRYS